MDSPKNFPEIARLAALLCDGRITETEMAALDRLLLNDPEAQAYYRQYMSLDVALEWAFFDRAFRPALLEECLPEDSLAADVAGLQAEADSVASVPPPPRLPAANEKVKEGRGEGDQLPSTVCRPCVHGARQQDGRGAGGEGDQLPSTSGGGAGGEGSSLPSPVLGFLGDVGRQGWGFVSDHTLLFSLLAVLALVGALWTAEGGRRKDEGGSEIGNRKIASSPLPPSVLRLQPSPNSPSRVSASPRPSVSDSPPVARLSKAVGCHWTNAQTVLPLGSELLAGEKIDLATGEAEIVFRNGAIVVLHGATMLELESAGSVRLLLGRVTARAETAAAHGFTVHTRTACLTDLGTEFDVQTAADGHSEVYVTVGAVEVRADGAGSAVHRLEAGQTAQIEPGDSGVVAIIESGDGTAAFKFPTIEPPSKDDYADVSRRHASIRVAEGRLSWDSGPADVLLDGRGQSKADAPHESAFFDNNQNGKLLVDLGKPVLVQKINTYSWHVYEKVPRGNDMRDVRATQRYTLYGAAGDVPPPTAGDPAAHGWTLISRVNTDEFFGVPPHKNRPAQQAVSITGRDGQLGRYRFLMWAVQPTHAEGYNPRPELTPCNQNTFFGEFDVYAE